MGSTKLSGIPFQSTRIRVRSPTPCLLFKINQNLLALEAAIMELTLGLRAWLSGGRWQRARRFGHNQQDRIAHQRDARGADDAGMISF
jgi:hypothetical protein